MTTQLHDFEIAHADFRIVHEDTPKRAIECMHLLFLDELLTAERIAFLKAAGSGDQASGSFDFAIEMISDYGLLVAFEKRKLTFNDVEPLTWSIDGLTRAHEATIAIPEFVPEVSQPKPPFSFDQILDWVVSIDLADNQIVRLDGSRVSVKRDNALSGMGASLANGDSPQIRDEAEIYGVDSKKRLFIKASLDEIPHGLCWIAIHDGNGVAIKRIPQMRLMGNRWNWSRELRSLSGDPSLPKKKRFKVFLIPADDSTRHLFASDEVRARVDSMPDGEQKTLALEFLEKGESK